MRAMVLTVLAAAVTPVLVDHQSSPALQAQCVVVDGARVGALPLTVSVGPTAVTFSEWTAKDVGASEMVGFRAQADGQVRFEVTAGDETWVGRGSEWLSPHGVVGPRAAPISSVRFCVD